MNRADSTPNVIFIGSFVDEAKDGSVGGQMFACRSILNSKVSERVNFLLIDSTVDTVPIPPVSHRFFKIFPRFFLLLKYLVTRRVDKVLIFASTGPSFIEKGLAVVISKIFFKQVIFAPCSGLMKDAVKKSRVFRGYVKFILRISDKVICQSESWKTFYQGIYPHAPDKFVVILNWIDTRDYIENNPVYQNKKGLATKLLYLGWLEEYKGIFDLIEAINLIKDKIPGLKVEIYGSGKAEKAAVKKSREYGLQNICVFKGRANHVVRFDALATADFYVLPSHAEGFPNALLEAMASGLPSIASNVGGVSEVIIPYETGMLVEPKDVKGLAEAIYELYTNDALRAKLSANGRNKVIEKNSLGIAERKLLELL